jgi:hypothetical protein
VPVPAALVPVPPHAAVKQRPRIDPESTRELERIRRRYQIPEISVALSALALFRHGLSAWETQKGRSRRVLLYFFLYTS